MTQKKFTNNKKSGRYDKFLFLPEDFDFSNTEKSEKIERIEIGLESLLKEDRGIRTERVKVTRAGKTFYREQRVGRKPPRKDTGKIASLPEDMKKEILDLRRLGYSGARIKESIENMFDIDPDLKDKFVGSGILTLRAGSASLNMTGQSLVDWAMARGVESTKKRKTIKSVESEAKEIEEKRFKEANEKLGQLQTENKRLQEQLDRERKSKMESDELRNKLNNENYILREKLKLLSKPVKETGKETDDKKLVSQYMAGMEHSSRHLNKIERIIEIDLSKVERGLREEKVKVTRGGKTFYRKQRVGQKEKEKPEKKKDLMLDIRLRDIADIGLEVGDKIIWDKNTYIVEGISDDGIIDIGSGKTIWAGAISKIVEKGKPKVEEKPKVEGKPKVEEKPKIEEKPKDLTREDYEEDKSIEYVDSRRSTASGRKILKSVSDYSGFEYKHINSYLRNPIRGESEDPMIEEIREFIRSSPKCSSEVYRGMGFNGKEGGKEYNKVLSQFKEGKVVKVKSFTSTSLSENVAKRFWEGHEGYEYQIRFNIKSKNGVILDGIGIAEEMEVLFMDKTKFKVTKVSVGIDNRNSVIDMEEI